MVRAQRGDQSLPARFASERTIHDGWCRLHLVSFRSEDGEEFTREVEDHGDAVAVLPYDEVRGTVLLVKLPRAPVSFASGEGKLLEAPAGMVDSGEDVETTARREALEEVGVRLDGMELVACAWSSPGISTERISLFLAPYGRTNLVGAGGGVEGENEEIEILELGVDDAWAELTASGRVVDLKTLFLMMSLRRRRPDLFSG